MSNNDFGIGIGIGFSLGMLFCLMVHTVVGGRKEKMYQNLAVENGGAKWVEVDKEGEPPYFIFKWNSELNEESLDETEEED